MDEQQKKELEIRLNRLKLELEDLHARWPAHSVKPAMLAQLEELEEEIERIQSILEESKY